MAAAACDGLERCNATVYIHDMAQISTTGRLEQERFARIETERLISGSAFFPARISIPIIRFERRSEAFEAAYEKFAAAFRAELASEWAHFADFGSPTMQVVEQTIRTHYWRAFQLSDFADAFDRDCSQASLEFYFSKQRIKDLVRDLGTRFDVEAVAGGPFEKQMAGTIREALVSGLVVRRRFRFRSRDDQIDSTREWVREHMLWTGCPPPAGEADQGISVSLYGVMGSGFANFRPAHHSGATAWPHRRAAEGRLIQHCHEGRPSLRLRRGARPRVHVSRRPRFRSSWNIEGRGGSTVGNGVRMGRRFWCNQRAVA